MAELVVKARGEHLACEHVLKYQVGVRKFFSQGVSLDPVGSAKAVLAILSILY